MERYVDQVTSTFDPISQVNLEIVVWRSGRPTQNPKTMRPLQIHSSMTAPDLVRLPDRITLKSSPFRLLLANVPLKRKNVILFGETGVGKSSVINLMAGAEVASTSTNLEGCTLEATEYSFTLPGGPSLRIYDTVGLNEPEMGVNTFFGAIEKAHKLITSLHNAGGIDLLIFCIRGNRITGTMQRNYRLFSEFLCEGKVPLAFVVTHLEYEEVMENWWQRNEKTFGEYGIQSVAHACITAAPARVATLATKRAESLSALQKMLHDSLGSPDAPYVKDIRSWFVRMFNILLSFLMKGLPRSFRRKALLKELKTRCGLSEADAERLADMLMRGG